MKYERPEMELVVLERVEVITISGQTETKNDSGIPVVNTPDEW